MHVNKCRICNGTLMRIFSFGKMPIVNYYLSRRDLDRKERKYPLNFCICKMCGLAQLNELVSPSKLFSTYHYASSSSLPLKKHLFYLADLCRRRFNLKKGDKALDIGCNDGIFLRRLNKFKMDTLGIDPAKNIVKNTKKLGIEIIAEFFNSKMGLKLQKKGKRFDLIAATNTLAQIIDLHGFVEGVKAILAKDGVFVAEVGYMVDMIKNITFDAIYHEHYSYFGLQSLVMLFEKHQMEIFDAQRIPSHGGSLRIFVKHNRDKKETSKRVLKIISQEKKLKLDKKESYKKFISSLQSFKQKFILLLDQIKKNNKSIVGIGAPAKSVITLNYCGINTTIIDYIVDSTPYKQYRFMPGVHIPIYPEEYLKNADTPDYFLVLAWTYKNEILRKLSKYRKKGAKIIIPFPRITII